MPANNRTVKRMDLRLFGQVRRKHWTLYVIFSKQSNDVELRGMSDDTQVRSKEYDNFYYTYPDISGHWFSAKPAEKMRGSRISGFIQDYHGEKIKFVK